MSEVRGGLQTVNKNIYTFLVGVKFTFLHIFFNIVSLFNNIHGGSFKLKVIFPKKKIVSCKSCSILRGKQNDTLRFSPNGRFQGYLTVLRFFE